jgi:alpha,alpha-trehalase
VYYWDSYFTMLGLLASGRQALVRSMADNFAFELATYGLIPNGSRTYYLTRSQPPFFALMVELVAQSEGSSAYARYRRALEREYAYWNDRTAPTRHIVTIGSAQLDRYFDQSDAPREEEFAADEAVARASSARPAELYRDLRSAAESGWDFSSRWLADGRSLATIETTRIVPVDLNSLLCQLEATLAKAYDASGEPSKARSMRAAANRRKAALRALCWSAASGYFFDYNLDRQAPTGDFTLAGIVPLFLRLAEPAQGRAAAQTVAARFLQPGGVATSLSATGQQWDSPNGWAPLQWMTVVGLRNYGENGLAEEIARRWLRLGRGVYRRTGRMMEKYNVVDTSLPAGGGEYPSQDGFGWTNGVFLALEKLYPGD